MNDFLSLLLKHQFKTFTVIQEGTITASLGGSVRLPCSRSDGSVVGSNQPTWVYQALGSVPKGLVGSDATNHNIKPPGISDRLTGSISGGSAVLSIINVQAADDGEYYCVLWTGSACTVLQTHTKLNK
uniref:Ig-like domain-containing protein n=1 Tax=Pyxicephalus adspersus TaxID=30357 RepID=A0AAV3ADH3_PYXAD|nr:TPA: hypothetical protein GDO54_014003 [Pyxicephalus adspersus]